MTRVTLLVALIPLTSFAQNSSAQERAVANQLAQDVESQSTVLSDPAVVRYVDRIGQKVAQAANLGSPLTVKVITGDSSFAFPGASCYLSTRLIQTTTSEAELAGAIAHLLGHIALWHDSHQAQTDPQTVGQIPIIRTGDCLRLSAGGFAIPMGAVSRQGDLEAQADQLGLGYMDKAGYDPGALADLFERMLSQTHKPSVFKPWAAFPASTRALADVLRIRGNNYIVTTSEFSTIQDRLSALAAASVRTEAPTLYKPVAPQVEHEVKLVEDPPTMDYVNRVARKVAAPAAFKIPPAIKVIEGDDARAITVPEGISYFTTGLILVAANEAELAGAIAHQLGHIADAPGKTAGSDGLWLRVAGSSSLSADQLAAEERTDLRGLDYMEKAGYDPGALVGLYERILGQALPSSTRARADALRNGRDLVVTTSGFREMQRRLAALPH